MLRQLRKRKNGSVYSSSAVNTEIDLVKNIVARFDLGEERELVVGKVRAGSLSSGQHLVEEVEPVNV